jgi:hypothetical protein
VRQYNYGHLAQALRRLDFIPTRHSHHTVWEKLEVQGTARRVIVRGAKTAKIPYSVLQKLLSHACVDERELDDALGWH